MFNVFTVIPLYSKRHVWLFFTFLVELCGVSDMQGTGHLQSFSMSWRFWWVFSHQTLNLRGRDVRERRWKDSQWPGWIHLENLITCCATALCLAKWTCVPTRCFMSHKQEHTVMNWVLLWTMSCLTGTTSCVEHNQDQNVPQMLSMMQKKNPLAKPICLCISVSMYLSIYVHLEPLVWALQRWTDAEQTSGPSGSQWKGPSSLWPGQSSKSQHLWPHGDVL